MTDDPPDQDHHFVPQFVLERWAKPKLTAYYWVQRGKLIAKPYFPRQVGYVPNLYKLQTELHPKHQAIEMDFFSPIDSKAADVIRCLLDDRHSGQVTPQQLEALMVFVLSLEARGPAGIEKGERIAQRIADGIGAETGQAISPEEVKDRARIGVMEAIIDAKRLQTLKSMRCQVLDVGDHTVDLLLGDQPLIRDGANAEADCTLFLPLSPTHVLALWGANITPKFDDAVAIVDALNKDTVTRSAQFVWGTGPHHKDLVEEFLPKKF